MFGPNITGSFNMVNHNPVSHQYSGVFAQASYSGNSAQGLTGGGLWGEGWGTVQENFNASGSNATYVGTTIQPKALHSQYLIRY